MKLALGICSLPVRTGILINHRTYSFSDDTPCKEDLLCKANGLTKGSCLLVLEDIPYEDDSEERKLGILWKTRQDTFFSLSDKTRVRSACSAFQRRLHESIFNLFLRRDEIVLLASSSSKHPPFSRSLDFDHRYLRTVFLWSCVGERDSQ